MSYLIAIDPKLNLSPAEFVSAWNNSIHSNTGTASLSETSSKSYISTELAVALIAAAVSVPTTIIAGFVTELLTKKFLDREPPKVTVTTISTPDGQPLLIIKEETFE